MRFTTLLVIAAVFIGVAETGYAQQPANKTACRSYGDSEFRLGPGDVIQVYVYVVAKKEPDLSADALPVRPDGKISLPQIGELPANGKTPIQLEGEIAGKLADIVANPKVNVVVKEVNSNQVSVLGEVKEPGMYKLTNKATVLDVVAQAGGFTEYAKKSKLIVLREGPTGEQRRIELNVQDHIKGKTGARDLFCVLPYDKIYVQ